MHLPMLLESNWLIFYCVIQIWMEKVRQICNYLFRMFVELLIKVYLDCLLSYRCLHTRLSYIITYTPHRAYEYVHIGSLGLLPLLCVCPYLITLIFATWAYLIRHVVHKWHLYRPIVRLFNCIIPRYHQLTNITWKSRSAGVETNRPESLTLCHQGRRWSLKGSGLVLGMCIP